MGAASFSTSFSKNLLASAAAAAVGTALASLYAWWTESQAPLTNFAFAGATVFLLLHWGRQAKVEEGWLTLDHPLRLRRRYCLHDATGLVDGPKGRRQLAFPDEKVGIGDWWEDQAGLEAAILDSIAAAAAPDAAENPDTNAGDKELNSPLRVALAHNNRLALVGNAGTVFLLSFMGVAGLMGLFWLTVVMTLAALVGIGQFVRTNAVFSLLVDNHSPSRSCLMLLVAPLASGALAIWRSPNLIDPTVLYAVSATIGLVLMFGFWAAHWKMTLPAGTTSWLGSSIAGSLFCLVLPALLLIPLNSLHLTAALRVQNALLLSSYMVKTKRASEFHLVFQKTNPPYEVKDLVADRVWFHSAQPGDTLQLLEGKGLLGANVFWLQNTYKPVETTVTEIRDRDSR